MKLGEPTLLATFQGSCLRTTISRLSHSNMTSPEAKASQGSTLKESGLQMDANRCTLPSTEMIRSHQ